MIHKFIIKQNIKKARYIFILYCHIVILLNVLDFGRGQTKLNEIVVAGIRADFWLHVLLFLPWALLAQMAGLRKWPWLLTGLAFAFISEYIQFHLHYRSFYLYDVYFNITGVLTGYALLWGFSRLLQQFCDSGTDFSR